MLSTYILHTALVFGIVTTELYAYSDSASVFRIIPKADEDIQFLNQLDNDVNGIEFWKGPGGINQAVDLMVSANNRKFFESEMKERKLLYTVEVHDVQQLLDNATSSFSNRAGYSKEFGFTQFHTLGEIYDWLDHLEKTYPKIVKSIVGGKSHEGRPIKGVYLSFAPGKSGVFIEAGIHAREWLSPSTATYLINELLTSKDQNVRQLAESLDWYIFPSFNPDGYVFTHTNPRDRQIRMWRKSRKPPTGDKRCYGVDLNRNWGFQWAGSGSADNHCSEVFSGPSAFSEIESKTMSEYITSISHKLFAYISFHTYANLLMFPYGHTVDHLDNYDEQYSVGLRAVDGLSKRYGSKFSVGNIAESLGPAGGNSMDWVKSTIKLPFVYVYELRGQTQSGETYGFIAPPSEIVPSGQEIVDSLVALFKEADKYYPRLIPNFL